MCLVSSIRCTICCIREKHKFPWEIITTFNSLLQYLTSWTKQRQISSHIPFGNPLVPLENIRYAKLFFEAFAMGARGKFLSFTFSTKEEKSTYFERFGFSPSMIKSLGFRCTLACLAPEIAFLSKEGCTNIRSLTCVPPFLSIESMYTSSDWVGFAGISANGIAHNNAAWTKTM